MLSNHGKKKLSPHSLAPHQIGRNTETAASSPLNSSVPVTVLGVGIGCQMLNNCNGHGTCSTGTKSCVCLRGWGAPSDVAYYKAPDCSQSEMDILVDTLLPLLLC